MNCGIKFIRGLIIIFFILYGSYNLFGQETKLLILEKTGSTQRITYTVGDEIILRLKGERFDIREKIRDIGDSLIFLGDFFVPVRNIEYVKTVHTRGFLSPSNGPKLIIAGLALFTFDLLNQTLIQNNSYEFNKGINIASASLIAAGGILISFKYRKFKPGRKKRIRTFVN